MRDDFAIFICTHGRPDSQLTLNLIKRGGYKGKWYLVLDDTDETIQQYIDNYGTDNIIIFDKNYYINNSEVGTNNPSFKCILYAKNAVEDIAVELGLSAFMLSDDDNKYLWFRWADDEKCRACSVDGKLDEVIDAYTELILDCDIVATGFGFSQFYFGGKDSFNYENYQKLRVPYNMVFRNAKFKVNWISSFGEDIITAIQYGKVGQVWTSLPDVQVETSPVGEGSGGMGDTYNSINSFNRAMYDFMYHPTATRPYLYQNKFMASINRKVAFPKIISDSYRKEK